MKGFKSKYTSVSDTLVILSPDAIISLDLEFKFKPSEGVHVLTNTELGILFYPFGNGDGTQTYTYTDGEIEYWVVPDALEETRRYGIPNSKRKEALQKAIELSK